MANKHVYLNNRKSKRSGFNRKRNVQINDSGGQESQETKTIKEFQVGNLRSYYSVFTTTYSKRYARRTITFPSYIDVVKIQFFPTFSEDLRRKFYIKYGLLPIYFEDFNRTVYFEIVDEDLFDAFKEDLEYIISQTSDVPYSGEDHNLIAIIYKFEFIDKRSLTDEERGIVISMINSVNNIANTQKETFKAYLNENELGYTANSNEDLFYLEELTAESRLYIERNFDIVQAITCSRPLNLRPGTFGTLRTDYGFSVDIPENLTTVGVIDTGVNNIPPFNGLIDTNGINITGQTNNDHSGHGTLVAGLTIFGDDLPAEVQDSYSAKCKVFPIKVLHNNSGGIDFPALLNAIRVANIDHGVRIFNMSLGFSPKKYNEAFSNYAYELDNLAHELNLLIFISVGNFDALSLEELLTTDYHENHSYPDFFYSLNSSSPVHSCENTNICTPSESLNNVSVGALAGNIEEGDNSDITPINYYPAYYSRKYHYDFNQQVNSTKISSKQKSKFMKHMNKPDLVFDGGDLFNDNSGIEVLSDPGTFFSRTCGTSLSTPLITSLAAQIERNYPDLDVQSIKALLINSASYYKSSQLPDFTGKESLLRKLIGFGVPNNGQLIYSNKNSITMVIEDEIKPLEILSIPINLPDYLKTSGNKLRFDISLAFSTYPDKGNHLGYQPLHISFNLMKSLPINDIAEKKVAETAAKKSFSWSEDHFGKENIIFSNSQRKEYKLQPTDLVKLNGQIVIAVRCLSKDNVSETIKAYLTRNSHPFSIVITITEEVRNETSHDLYNEIVANNNVTVIGDVDASTDLDLEVEG